MDYIPLTDQQLKFYDTFGFLKFPGLLADRIKEIQDAFETVFQERGGGHGGKAHDGKARSCAFQFADHSTLLSALLDDPHINGVASSILGDDFNYMGSDGNYYVGDTPWHSDGWRAQVRHLKIAFYLDNLTAQSGALRVVPGSHKVGEPFAEQIQAEIWDSQGNWGVEGRDVPALALDITPGDVLVFDHNIKHAAFGGGNRRRMFTLNCCQRYPAEKIEELKSYTGTFAKFWIDRVYGPKILESATPRRWKHLEQVYANDGHLAALSRKARNEMAEPSRQ